MKSWVYLYFPSLELDLLLQQEADLSSVPVVLYHPGTLEIGQLNEEARTRGIRRGMSLSDVWMLAGDLQVFTLQSGTERQQLLHIALALYQFFGDIAVDAPNGLWVEVSTMRKLHQTSGQSIQYLVHILQGLAVNFQIGRGHSPLAAKTLAQAGVFLEQADVGWPQIEQALGSVDIFYTPFEAKYIQKLKRMGFNTIGRLIKVPVASLGRRLGSAMVAYVAQLQGRQIVPLQYFQPPVHFYQRMQLACEVENWQGLRFALNRLLLALEEYLRLRQKQTRQLRLSLYARENQVSRVLIGVSQGGYKAQDFFTLCQLRLEREGFPHPVIELSLTVDKIENRAPAAPADLTVSTSKQSTNSLPQLLNILHTRLGEQRVQGLAIGESWVPEQAQLQVKAGKPVTAKSEIWRPAWLLSSPVKVEISQWQIKSEPERLQTHWWDEANVQCPARDYVLALDSDGAYGWLYFDHTQNQWYLHGWGS